MNRKHLLQVIFSHLNEDSTHFITFKSKQDDSPLAAVLVQHDCSIGLDTGIARVSFTPEGEDTSAVLSSLNCSLQGVCVIDTLEKGGLTLSAICVVENEVIGNTTLTLSELEYLNQQDLETFVKEIEIEGELTRMDQP